MAIQGGVRSILSACRSRRRLLFLVLVKVSLLSILLSISSQSNWGSSPPDDELAEQPALVESATVRLPRETDLSIMLRKRNALPPRNRDLYPVLPKDHLVVVIYVHRRPEYFKVAVEGLSKVQGINETLLIVSHDGFFPEMNEIVDGIRFCQVKQLFASFSPHLFAGSFPGTSPGDCQGRDDPAVKACRGQADQYGNHRSPRIVSLKHHWWWMMNTVWDGLAETRGYNRHIVFVEEDHFLYPNAYRNLQQLCKVKSTKCPECWMVNLAPWDIKNRGERGPFFVAEKIGNMGYAFNRTVWNKLHASAHNFCHFDDYNWDITLWASVYPSWEVKTYTLRGPRASAIHFGKCGLHQGKKEGQPECEDFTGQAPAVAPEDELMNLDPGWPVSRHSYSGYPTNFKGWGGWGDSREHQLCMDFASMYRRKTGDKKFYSRIQKSQMSS